MNGRQLTLLLTLLTGIASCGPTSGRVQGDVFLVMQNGDVKRGAGNTVLMLGPADSVLAARTRVCRAFGEELLAAARKGGLPADSGTLAKDLHGRLLGSLVGFTDATSKTGINAHYRFDGVAPGKYVLWAETTIGENSYTWWAPVTVRGGDSVSKDLDNSTEARAVLYCGGTKDSLTPTLARVQDSAANFTVRGRRQGWLRCMTEARAELKRENGVVPTDVVDRQPECWTK